jgi:hypothetical protein
VLQTAAKDKVFEVAAEKDDEAAAQKVDDMKKMKKTLP